MMTQLLRNVALGWLAFGVCGVVATVPACAVSQDAEARSSAQAQPAPQAEQAKEQQPAAQAKPEQKKAEAEGKAKPDQKVAPKPVAEPVQEPKPATEEPAVPAPTSVEGLTPVTTESGLVYYDLKVGDGPQPLNEQTRATVHWSGWLGDGTPIGSSHKSDKPFTAPIDGVVPGWTEGVLSMKVGGKRRLEVPAALGYGENGAPRVPPNSKLVFEVELLAIENPPVQRSIEGLTPVTSESGLKYYDFKVGDGEQPEPGAIVSLNFTGWLADGKMFDTSATREQEVKYKLAHAVPGWKEGVGSMRVGGLRRLEIPAELGFGERGAPGLIPPNSDLIYEIELLGVIQPPKQTSVEGIEPVVAESGLKYWDIKVGEGTAAEMGATVQQHLSVWLKDGELFHSSVQMDQPDTQRVGAFPVEGWNQGVIGMKPGGKRRLEIPPALAFGEEGRPPQIPPNTTFIIEVDLLDVTPPPQQRSIEGIEPVVTKSGLKYWDLKVGDGDSPSETSTVVVHYTGWLTDGTVFDSSVERGEPETFKVNRVIKGWIEGIQSMKVGGIRRLEIKPELGYGDQPMRAIPPNSTLIFEVELLEIKDK